MTQIAILPVETENGEISYHAVAGEKQAQGKTVGEALDALTFQLAEGTDSSIVLVQKMRGDRFFTAAQQQRLSELMSRWREHRDRGEALPQDQQAELERLAELETQASAERAAFIADELGR
jgi:hypothetical protein